MPRSSSPRATAPSPSDLDRVFGALSDPTRRAILGRLATSPATVTELAAPFPISLNAVSKHIQVLERAGLLRRDIRGREHHCSLNPMPLRDAATWTEAFRVFWEQRLDALDDYLRTQAPTPTPRKRARR